MSVTSAGRKRRPRRIRPIRQTEQSECGLACLGMIANAYGSNLGLVGLRARCEVSARGSTLKSLVRSANGLGFNARAVRLGLADLRQLHLPAILHWNADHFVVIERLRGRKALVHDPKGRSEFLPVDRLSPHFTGVALELRPAADFAPVDDNQGLKLAQLLRSVSGLGPVLVQVLLLSIFLQAFVLISPYYMQVAIDRALPSSDSGLLATLGIGFGLFALFNSVAALLRALVLLSAGSELGFGMSANVARRLFRLPLAWFERREIGDVISRFQSIDPIRQFMTESAVAAVLDGSLALFTLAVMLVYSPLLAAIAVGGFLLYVLVRTLSYAGQRRAQEQVIVAAAREQSAMIESLRGMATLRVCNREAERHALWQNRLAEAINANVRFGSITTLQSVGNGLIFGLEQVLTIWLAVSAVIAGGLTLGMVFAYFAYRSQFLQKAGSLIDHAIAYRMLGLHLDRLSDIALAAPDPAFEPAALPPGPPRRLAGRIALAGVGFRYGPGEPWILRGLDLAIAPGEHVAVTGPSGAGKTTLVKILLGLLEPEEGQVLVDGVPLREFGAAAFRDQVGAVLQDDRIFTGSLADNIALFDADADPDAIRQAAQQAGLAADIAGMPMRYATPVGDMGSSLSGGQKQRLMLARALYRQPRVLVLDEGTAHLDARLETAVGDMIAALGVTRITVAHRVETIARAHRILALDGGALSDVTDRLEGLGDQVAARLR